MRSLPLLALAAILIGCSVESRPVVMATQASSAMEFAPPPANWNYPFSQVVRVGDVLYTSGQLGAKVENGAMVLVPGGIEEQGRQAMDNIRALLEANNSGMDRIFKCTVMIADMKEWPAFNTVYATYFPGPKPARSALGANGLALNAKVEVECAATVRPTAATP